jgi:hypothetical protein
MVSWGGVGGPQNMEPTGVFKAAAVLRKAQPAITLTHSCSCAVRLQALDDGVANGELERIWKEEAVTSCRQLCERIEVSQCSGSAERDKLRVLRLVRIRVRSINARR